MQARNGQPSRPGNTAGRGAVRAQPPEGELTSENPGQPPGTGDGGPAADGSEAALPPGTGQLPPDRPRPPEPPGPPPPVPDELPRRHADPSRPSVPSRLPRTPALTPGAGPAAPRVRPPPQELFRPLWWQERPGLPQPSPEASQAETTQTEAGQAEAGQAETTQPGPPPPGQRPPADPPWGTVLVTTARLWLRRRLGRAGRPRPARARWWVLIVAGLVAAAVLAAVVLSGRASQGAEQPAAAKALAAAAAARQRAAAWVAGQASPEAIVACDPAMCAALQAHGVAAGRLLVLAARSDPLGSDLVVATAAVRGQFGARLAGVYAPVTLASFGSGAARIDVRVVAPDGAAAYWAALAADVRVRVAAGAQLLRNRSIHVSAAARTALANGEVDPRLLAALAALAGLHPLDITGFGRPSPGASAGVPLRSADIAGAAPPGPGTPVSLQSLMAILRAQRPPYLPSSLAIVRIPPAGVVLRIGYPVPSPLGLLTSGH